MEKNTSGQLDYSAWSITNSLSTVIVLWVGILYFNHELVVVGVDTMGDAHQLDLPIPDLAGNVR